MVRTNLLQPSDVASDRYSRDQQIVRIFNLGQYDLDRVRQHTYLIDRLEEAARTIVARLTESGLDPMLIPSQLTLANLAMVADDGSYNKSPPMQAANTALKRAYKKRKAAIFEEYGLDVPYTQFLREDIGLYAGNLYDAKKRWKGMDVSKYDWLKDVRVPTDISQDVAILLGIYISHMQINPANEKGRSENSFEMYGRNIDFELYTEIVIPLIRKIHNIQPLLPGQDEGDILVSYDNFSYDLPALEISSRAVVSWLRDGIKMSRDKGDRRVPKLEGIEQKLGFLKGFIAAEASIYQYSDKSQVRIYPVNPDLSQDIVDLSKSLDLNPLFNEGSNYINFNLTDLINMIQMGIFVNPYHVQQTYNLGNKIIEPSFKRKLSSGELELLAFLHNCNVDHGQITQHLSIGDQSINYHLNIARLMGIRVTKRKPGFGRTSLVRDIGDVLKQWEGVMLAKYD
ncbi:MAG: hypothetical protein ABIJ08_07040 [Nanoarchaeota archaeon]